MPEWAMQLRSDHLEPIAELWHVPGVEATRHEGQVWLRGREPDDLTRQRLPTIPCVAQFEILPDRGLLRPGHRVPSGFLPVGDWQSLSKFLAVVLPPSSIPALGTDRVEIQLAPSRRPAEPNVLLTDLNSWVQFGGSVPQIRLKGCQFAVAGDGRVLILGTPLPPIAGTRAVARSGLVVPCGWTWSPAVDAEILAKTWGIRRGDQWLMWPGKPIERVLAEQWVAANHSAIQETWESYQNARAV